MNDKIILSIILPLAVIIGGGFGLWKMVNKSLTPPALKQPLSYGVVTNAPRR